MSLSLTLTEYLGFHVTQVRDLVLGHYRSILRRANPIERQGSGSTGRKMKVGKYGFTCVKVRMTEGRLLV